VVDDSSELVERAATTLVQFMTAHDDQAWEPIRHEFSALFAKAAHVASAELDRSRTEVVHDPGLASEAVGEWKAKLRRLVRANPEAAAPIRQILGRLEADGAQAQVSNTITGDVTGTAVQARTVHGGVGNTTYGGDHVDFSHGRFQGPVTGTKIEHHHEDTRVEQTGAVAGRDVIGVQNNQHGRDPEREG